jgi:hypothetical protein
VKAAVLLFGLLVASCAGDSSESAPSGLVEPFRVSYVPQGQTKAVLGQFFQGALVAGSDGPVVPLRGASSRVVSPGQSGLKLTGNAGPTATGVAMRFIDVGSGFWVIPTTIFDVENPGTIKFEGLLDFARDVPPGLHTLEVVAIDGQGHHGPAASPLSLSFQPPIPAAAAVATLTWDNNADVDLIIVLPDGSEISNKHLRSAAPDPDAGDLPGTGILERDSNANCVPDGRRQEMVVWKSLPPVGQMYLAKADLFSACGEAGANFEFNFYIGGQLKVSQAGRFLAQDADQGGPGLALVNFNFGQ